MRNKGVLQLNRPLIKSFIGLGVVRVFSIPLGLLISILLARELGPEAFGQYAFVISIVSILALPVAGGIPSLLLREVAVYSHEEKWGLYRGVLRFAHSWTAISSLMILSGYYFLADRVPEDSKWQLMTVAIFMIPFMGLSAVREGALKGLARPLYAELPKQLFQPLALLLVYIYFLNTGDLNVRTVISSQVVVSFVIFIISSLFFFRLQPSPGINIEPEYHTRQWARALFPFTLLSLVSTLSTQLSLVLLGLLSTDDQVAAMRVAERGAQLVVLSLTLVNLVVAPHFAKAWRNKNKDQLKRLARQAARVSFAIALPIGLVLLIAGRTLLGLVFGDVYALSAYYPMAVLVIGQLFSVFCGSVGCLLSMSGHENYTLKSQFISVFFSLMITIWLIPFYGALGAAIGVAVSVVTLNVLLSFFIIRNLMPPNC